MITLGDVIDNILPELNSTLRSTVWLALKKGEAEYRMKQPASTALAWASGGHCTMLLTAVLRQVPQSVALVKRVHCATAYTVVLLPATPLSAAVK